MDLILAPPFHPAYSQTRQPQLISWDPRAYFLVPTAHVTAQWWFSLASENLTIGECQNSLIKLLSSESFHSKLLRKSPERWGCRPPSPFILMPRSLGSKPRASCSTPSQGVSTLIFRDCCHLQSVRLSVLIATCSQSGACVITTWRPGNTLF